MLKFTTILLLLTIYSCSFNKFPVAEDYPSEAKQEELLLIKKGIKLKNQKKHKQAIANFKSVLLLNEHNISAIYQLCKTYYAMGDYKKSLDYSENGMEYFSQFRLNFILNAEQCLVKLKQDDDIEILYQEAIQSYNSKTSEQDLENINKDKEKIKDTQSLNIFHSKLGDYYFTQMQYKKAETSYQKAIRIYHFNSDSHFKLTKLYISQGRMFEAVISSLFFLNNENTSKRAKKLIIDMDYFINPRRVELTSNDSGILTQTNSKNEFSKFNIMWESIKTQINTDEKQKNNIEFTKIKKTITILSNLIEKEKVNTNFCKSYYFSIIKSMKDNDMFELMLYNAYSNSDYEGVKQWLANTVNQHRLNEYRKWYNKYDYDSFNN